MAKKVEPIEVTNLDMAFGCDVEKLMPDYEDIPETFRYGGTKWNKLFNDWFFAGLKSLNLIPKLGIDTNKALRHIRTIMGSFELKHEHKEAAIAFLLSEWFEEESTWESKRLAPDPQA